MAAALATAVWFVMNPSQEIAPSLSGPPSTASMADKSATDIPLAARGRGRTPTQAQKDSLATARADSILAAAGSHEPKRATPTDAKTDASGTTRTQKEASKTRRDDGKSTPSLATRDASKPARTVAENSAAPPGTGPTGTKPAITDSAAVKGSGIEVAKPATDRPAVAKQPDGSLSVYYLGGVGEFFVNGKRFTQQPPFDGVTFPAGTYRMACRMSGDTAPKEFTVTIRPNRETVIEYELGHDPVVTYE